MVSMANRKQQQTEAPNLCARTSRPFLHTTGLALQKKNGTLRADTITRDKLKGPAHGANVSDLEARINDGKGSLLSTSPQRLLVM